MEVGTVPWIDPDPALKLKCSFIGDFIAILAVRTAGYVNDPLARSPRRVKQLGLPSNSRAGLCPNQTDGGSARNLARRWVGAEALRSGGMRPSSRRFNSWRLICGYQMMAVNQTNTHRGRLIYRVVGTGPGSRGLQTLAP